MKLAAGFLGSGFLGAGAAFLLSAIVVGGFPGFFSSYQLVKILYVWGFFSPQDAVAGSFPNPIGMAEGRLLSLLAALCLILAALFYFLNRKKI